jgi:hypothetical protein
MLLPHSTPSKIGTPQKLRQSPRHVTFSGLCFSTWLFHHPPCMLDVCAAWSPLGPKASPAREDEEDSAHVMEQVVAVGSPVVLGEPGAEDCVCLYRLLTSNSTCGPSLPIAIPRWRQFCVSMLNRARCGKRANIKTTKSYQSCISGCSR